MQEQARLQFAEMQTSLRDEIHKQLHVANARLKDDIQKLLQDSAASATASSAAKVKTA